MTPTERNRIIHEKVMGKCWHEWELDDTDYTTGHWQSGFKCNKCQAEQWVEFGFQPINPDYSEWEHYGPMLEWAMTKEWWPLFIVKLIYVPGSPVESNDYDQLIPVELLNPLRGSTVIAEFLEERNP